MNADRRMIEPTICYGQPSVLLLYFELVPETLRLCILSFSVHMRLVFVTRRLSCLFHVRLLWGGSRHVYCGQLQAQRPALLRSLPAKISDTIGTETRYALASSLSQTCLEDRLRWRTTRHSDRADLVCLRLFSTTLEDMLGYVAVASETTKQGLGGGKRAGAAGCSL
jgi:hypothetical protein